MRGMVPKAFSNRHFWLRIFVFCWQLVSNTPFQTRWLCLAGVVHVCDASCRFQCWWKYVSHVAWLFLPVVKVLYWFGILISFDTSARFAQFVCFFLFPISSCYKVATVQDSYIKKNGNDPLRRTKRTRRTWYIVLLLYVYRPINTRLVMWSVSRRPPLLSRIFPATHFKLCRICRLGASKLVLYFFFKSRHPKEF